MRKTNIVLTQENFNDFRDWIQLDVEAISWHGKNKEDFELFWSHFFIDGLSFHQIIERFDYAIHQMKIGPLVSWFEWLKGKLIVYIFTHREISLHELAIEGGLNMPSAANLIRTFLSEKFPFLETQLNELFQVGNVACDNIHLTYSFLVEHYPKLKDVSGTIDYEVMPYMEITLYDEWKTFCASLKTDVIGEQLDVEKIRRNTSFKKQLHFVKELVVLLVVGFILVLGIKIGNEMYEKHLVDRISVYEPQFMWLDKTLKFKKIAESEKSKSGKVAKIDFDKIIVPESKSEDSRDLESSLSFGTETDVNLTSWDSLPKDLDEASSDQSAYEESRKGGYRDFTFGRKKVYRVIINTVASKTIKRNLDEILSNFDVSQYDNVKPGTEVPGGYYYNLYVPIDSLKSFLSKVMIVDDSILYESRTSRRSPRGKTKVLIWVKTI